MAILQLKAVGFIGLGAMGKWMATHLAEKLPPPAKMYVFDIVPALIDELCANYPQKVVSCSSPKDVGDKSGIVFTMLPEGKHVKEVYLGPDGICTSDVNGKTLIDCSTIDTATFLLVKDQVEKKFPLASFYDAPVSGGVLGAKKGTIAFYLGCSESNIKAIHMLTELLSLMGSQVIPCGGPSYGLAAKLSNNYLSGMITIACSEAMDMGMRSGLDPRILAKVFAAGTAQNTICDRFCPVPGICAEAPSSKGYKNGFKVQLMQKDISLALEMARSVGAKNVLGEVGLNTYKRASEDVNCRDLDSRVVFRYLNGNENWHIDRIN